MPIETDCHMRIGNQNLLKNSEIYNYPSITTTSENTSYPKENFLNDKRYKYFSFENHFEVETSTSQIYINDGSDKTTAIVVGSYTTGALLATNLQTQLNTVSSNWTVSYSSNRFTISNTGSVTLRFSSTNNAAWDLLGFTSASDETGTSFVANEIRNHSTERIKIDFGGSVDVGLCAIIGPSNEEFSFSDSSIITLYGNNLDDFDSSVSVGTLTVNDDGAYLITDRIDATYRFFWIEINDKRNPDYNPKISNIYLGEYISTTYNISNALTLGKVDRSNRFESENGIFFSDIKSKYWFYGTNYAIFPKEDLTKFLELWDKEGITQPFYIAIDHQTNITESQKQTCKFVNFNEGPTFQHIIYDKYSVNFSFREFL